jgi:hypothetical protein
MISGANRWGIALVVFCNISVTPLYEFVNGFTQKNF